MNNLKPQEQEILNLLQTGDEQNIEIAKQFKISEKSFFKKIGWDILGYNKYNDCISKEPIENLYWYEGEFTATTFVLTQGNIENFEKVKIFPNQLVHLVIQGCNKIPCNLPHNLKKLSCQFYNNIEELPENLPDSLEELILCQNLLVKLPKLPPNLKVLYCDRNKIAELPEKLPSELKILSCGYNKLTKLPENLPNTLEELNLCNNSIVYLPYLPLTLKALRCNYNNICNLPNALPPNLETLKCSYNRLILLPPLPLSLTHFESQGNKLEQIPDLNLPNLRYLNLYNQKSCE